MSSNQIGTVAASAVVQSPILTVSNVQTSNTSEVVQKGLFGMRAEKLQQLMQCELALTLACM